MTSDTATASTLSGAELRAIFTTAAVWLERNAPSLNAINVFPVPDGDTGTNMTLTLRAAVEETQRAGDSVSEVTAALAHGALMGARGNSGVILSQYLKGIAARLAQVEAVDGPGLAGALVGGAVAARAAVTNPVEGTILTVAREAGRGAEQAAGSSADVAGVLEAAVAAARDAVSHTPDLLPVLREAGVVDSGGMGLCVALEGALCQVRGEPLPVVAEDAGHISHDWLAAQQDAHQRGGGRYGYCVQFIVRADRLDERGLRGDMEQLGDSVLVVGESGMVRVHLHTDDPGGALQRGTVRGLLAGIRIDNMDEQAGHLLSQPPATSAPTGPFSVVAVAAGAGLAETLRGAGAEVIVEGGQTMNPSTREILAAIEAATMPRAVVLPNNKNIIWTAEQAATLSRKAVEVIPTRSIPQGIAALLAVTPDHEPAEALGAMRAAAGRVHTIEVTRAARSVRLGGLQVEKGGPIALLDDELVAAGATADEAATAALETSGAGDGSLITVYYGASVAGAAAESLAAWVRQRFAGAEVEVVAGGQPFYDYIISVE